MRSLIEQFRRCPTIENATRLRQYFQRHPSRIWVASRDEWHALAAAGVRSAKE